MLTASSERGRFRVRERSDRSMFNRLYDKRAKFICSRGKVEVSTIGNIRVNSFFNKPKKKEETQEEYTQSVKLSFIEAVVKLMFPNWCVST